MYFLRIITIVLFALTAFDSFGQNKSVTDSLNQVLSEDISEEQKMSIYLALLDEFVTRDSIKVNQYAQLAIELGSAVDNREAIYQARTKVGEMNVHFGNYERGKATYNELLKEAEETGDLVFQAKALSGIGVIALRQGEYEASEEAYKGALEVLRELEDRAEEVNAIASIARVMRFQGKNDEALVLYDEAIELGEREELTTELAYAYTVKGNYYGYQGAFEESKKYFLLASALYEEAGDPRVANIYNNMGLIFTFESQLAKSLDYYHKSLAIHEAAQDKFQIANTLLNIGLVYFNQEDFDEALNYYSRTLKMYEELGSQREISLVSNNLGNIYKDQGQLEVALPYYHRSMAICLEINNKQELLYNYINIGDAHEGLGRSDSAIYYLKKAVSLGKETGDQRALSEGMNFLGKAYFGINQMPLARKWLREGVELAKELDYQLAIREGSIYLAQVESALGNFREAYRLSRTAATLRDSIINKENIKKITLLQADYEFEKEKDSMQFANDRALIAKNNEIALLEAEEQVNRLRFLLFVGGASLLLVLGFFIARYRVRVKAAETRQLQEVSDFKEAMTGMIAHDLKNPLGVILGTESELPSTRNMARQMLRLVENMLDVHKFEKAEVKLKAIPISFQELSQEAIQQVKTLLEEKNISIDQHSNQNLQVLGDPEILLRVMINLLTNAIKYSDNNSSIDIISTQEENDVKIQVRDHGSGIPKGRMDEIFRSYRQIDPRTSGSIGSTGLGLTFCKLAIEAHDSSILVDSEMGKGTTFTFALRQAGVVEEASSETESYKLTIPEEDRKLILDLLPTLRSYKFHQAMQMEDLLKPLGENHEATQKWVDAILNAAYLGNKEHFEELLEVIHAEEVVNKVT